MRSARWVSVVVLWAGVAGAAAISPAVAQAPPYPPPPPPYGAVPAPALSGEAADIASCLCLRQAVDATGADMMIKAAYTQSRIRQMIFGGATRHIIMESKIPVIMAR